MPCEDCLEIKAELVAQKDFMSHWFGVLLKHIESVESGFGTFREEIIGKLDRLEKTISNPEDRPVVSGGDSAEGQGESAPQSEKDASLLDSLMRYGLVKMELDEADASADGISDFNSHSLADGELGTDFGSGFEDASSSFFPGQTGRIVRKKQRKSLPKKLGKASSSQQLPISIDNPCELMQNCPSPTTDKAKKSESAGEKKVQGKPSVSPVKCNLCSKMVLNFTEQMNRHATTHLGIKPFQCTLCSYSSFRSDKARQHLAVKHKVHHGAKLIADYATYKTQRKDKIKECFGNVKMAKRHPDTQSM